MNPVLFDFGVNAGTGRSMRLPRRCIGAVPDEVPGSRPLAAVRTWDSRAPIVTPAKGRLAPQRGLLAFGALRRGWTRRVEGTRAAALATSRAVG